MVSTMIGKFLADSRAYGPAVLRAKYSLRHADHVGTRVRVDGLPVVQNRGTMRIGDRVRIRSTVATTELVAERGGTLEIEDRVYINFGCNIAASLLVRIGADTQIGPHCMLLDSAYHRIEPERRLERPEPEAIVLESNVWLSARVIVLPGVTIGADSCVAAGSVVTKDVAPRTFVAGVPAVFVRDL